MQGEPPSRLKLHPLGLHSSYLSPRRGGLCTLSPGLSGEAFGDQRCTFLCTLSSSPACFVPMCLAPFVFLERQTTSCGCGVTGLGASMSQRMTPEGKGCNRYYHLYYQVPFIKKISCDCNNDDHLLLAYDITKQEIHYIAEGRTNTENLWWPHGPSPVLSPSCPPAGVAGDATPCLAVAGPGRVASAASCGRGGCCLLLPLALLLLG